MCRSSILKRVIICCSKFVVSLSMERLSVSGTITVEREWLEIGWRGKKRIESRRIRPRWFRILRIFHRVLIRREFISAIKTKHPFSSSGRTSPRKRSRVILETSIGSTLSRRLENRKVGLEQCAKILHAGMDNPRLLPRLLHSRSERERERFLREGKG